MKFTKMHGLGNDYIYIDCFYVNIENPSALAKRLSDRHFGIGSDGLVLILPSTEADFRMRMFNSDGSEAEMCGNAIRCVGKYIYDNGLTNKTNVEVETLAGIKVLELTMNNDKVALVRVDMGEPILETQKIPVNSESDRFIAQPVEMDAMHRREGYDSDAMYDVTRNIMLGQGVPIPYPGKYWTAEVFLDGCDQYSTAYMFSAEL